MNLEAKDLAVLLESAKDGDCLELSGHYTIDRQVILPRRISLKGRDYNTIITVDASKDPNAGIWYSHPTTGWGTPRMPVIIENLTFEAAPNSLYKGVGVAFVANFHGSIISRCRFDNLGQRSLLVWGGLFIQLDNNFFSRSGIWMPGCEKINPHPEWKIDISRMPLTMEMNQIHIRGGEMQYGYPATKEYPGNYMLDITHAGAIIIENFCIEGVEDQGAISFLNSRNILIRNLWIEGVGSRSNLGVQRNYKGLVNFTNCTAVKVTGGHLTNSSFTGACYSAPRDFQTYLYWSMVPLFNLENVCNIIFENGNSSAELITPGFLRTDDKCAGVIFRENSSRHYQAISGDLNIETRDNVVSAFAPWLLQAADDMVQPDLPMVPLHKLTFPAAPAPKTGEHECYVLDLQMKAEKAASARIILLDNQGQRVQDFPIELSTSVKRIRFGLCEYPFASRGVRWVVHPKSGNHRIQASFVGWRKIPTSLHVDPSGRKQYLGLLPR